MPLAQVVAAGVRTGPAMLAQRVETVGADLVATLTGTPAAGVWTEEGSPRSPQRSMTPCQEAASLSAMRGSVLWRNLSLAPVQLIVELACIAAVFLLAEIVTGVAPANPFLQDLLPGDGLLLGLEGAGALLVLAVVGTRLERRPLSELGIGLRHLPELLLTGFILGAVLIALVIGILTAIGSYRVEAVATPGAAVVIVVTGAAVMLGVAVWEEVVFRGVLFRLLEQSLGSWLALLPSAVLFGFAHLGNPAATPLSAVALAVFGVFFGALFMVTRSLWPCIGFHCAWNLLQGQVFGTPLSGVETPSALKATLAGPDAMTGGAFGPVAGAPAVAVVGVAAIGLLLLARRQGRIFTPSWAARARSPQPGGETTR